MIRHIVLTRFREDVSDTAIHEIYSGLAQVATRLPGTAGFHGGRSTSPEQIERGYLHGFTIDFDTWDDLKTYANDPEHRALGAQLVAAADGGVDGLLVLDIEV